jgi:DNA-binding response OmpR family regulator
MRGLREEGFNTVPAPDGATALRLATADICAAVLDIGLPDADGRDVCQAMRANGFLSPVIFLTAHHRLPDRLSGFSAGGDDYLPKPFHLTELAARLRAALKRAAPPPAVTTGDPVLDAVRHLAGVRGTRVDPTPTEFRLLAVLMAASGGIVRRRELVRAGRPEGAQVHDNPRPATASSTRRTTNCAPAPPPSRRPSTPAARRYASWKPPTTNSFGGRLAHARRHDGTAPAACPRPLCQSRGCTGPSFETPMTRGVVPNVDPRAFRRRFGARHCWLGWRTETDFSCRRGRCIAGLQRQPATEAP